MAADGNSSTPILECLATVPQQPTTAGQDRLDSKHNYASLHLTFLHPAWLTDGPASDAPPDPAAAAVQGTPAAHLEDVTQPLSPRIHQLPVAAEHRGWRYPSPLAPLYAPLDCAPPLMAPLTQANKGDGPARSSRRGGRGGRSGSGGSASPSSSPPSPHSPSSELSDPDPYYRGAASRVSFFQSIPSANSLFQELSALRHSPQASRPPSPTLQQVPSGSGQFQWPDMAAEDVQGAVGAGAQALAAEAAAIIMQGVAKARAEVLRSATMKERGKGVGQQVAGADPGLVIEKQVGPGAASSCAASGWTAAHQPPRLSQVHTQIPTDSATQMMCDLVSRVQAPVPEAFRPSMPGAEPHELEAVGQEDWRLVSDQARAGEARDSLTSLLLRLRQSSRGGARFLDMDNLPALLSMLQPSDGGRLPDALRLTEDDLVLRPGLRRATAASLAGPEDGDEGGRVGAARAGQEEAVEAVQQGLAGKDTTVDNAGTAAAAGSKSSPHDSAGEALKVGGTAAPSMSLPASGGPQLLQVSPQAVACVGGTAAADLPRLSPEGRAAAEPATGQAAGVAVRQESSESGAANASQSVQGLAQALPTSCSADRAYEEEAAGKLVEEAEGKPAASREQEGARTPGSRAHELPITTQADQGPPPATLISTAAVAQSEPAPSAPHLEQATPAVPAEGGGASPAVLMAVQAAAPDAQRAGVGAAVCVMPASLTPVTNAAAEEGKVATPLAAAASTAAMTSVPEERLEQAARGPSVAVTAAGSREQVEGVSRETAAPSAAAAAQLLRLQPAHHPPAAAAARPPEASTAMLQSAAATRAASAALTQATATPQAAAAQAAPPAAASVAGPVARSAAQATGKEPATPPPFKPAEAAVPEATAPGGLPAHPHQHSSGRCIRAAAVECICHATALTTTCLHHA
ncbi:hypothetical protein HaLaN_01153 [Haematococcus lacustris]|uniref:Uncharacterized protein n=1 Tax=Haematococcus lacustris TaxID=44745 RepID=A0A699YF96_HAELA|nr:hypothetical protein HaLaN_01153 [Haematococcus lacustris]